VRVSTRAGVSLSDQYWLLSSHVYTHRPSTYGSD
jgi:hypothetical protein